MKTIVTNEDNRKYFLFLMNRGSSARFFLTPHTYTSHLLHIAGDAGFLFVLKGEHDAVERPVPHGLQVAVH